MVDGILYGTTIKTGIYRSDDLPTNGGHSDGQITLSVESHEYPTEDNQSNFGTGYYYRFGENHTIEVFMEESSKWVIFEAYKDLEE